MKRTRKLSTFAAAICLLAALASAATVKADDDLDALLASMLGDTPILDDLQELTDTIGGRPTGSRANEATVDWALEVFSGAGVPASAEAFEMPMQWQEVKTVTTVAGDVIFQPRAVAAPFSTGTGANGLQAALVDGAFGSEDDFAQLGVKARGAWVLIETPVLDDKAGLDGLFAEYNNAAAVEPRAFDAGAAGIVFMSSRPKNLLYRHNASLGTENQHPILIMERESAKRALRLLRNGKALSLTAAIEVDRGGAYKARNVIGEIRGADRPEEVVLFGAHLDSFGLGTGALDNGANVAMLIDIARQINRLGLKPERTIRFALWNGEEQGLVGSWRYTEQHSDELDSHVVAASFDIGTGAITGFFTNGREKLVPIVDEFLRPVAGLGPFQQVNVPVVGTDNFDFMIEGVPNLIANQADANYASNYHAESDTFDKVDQQQLKLNSAIAAALVWGFANGSDRLPRQTHAEIAELIDSTDLEQQMRNFAVWKGWENGERGRHDQESPPQPEAPPDAATAIEGAHEAPGSDANGPALDPALDIGAEQVRARNRSRANLESAHGLRVAEYSIVPYRRLEIELENGQVWRQIEGDTQRIRVDLERNRTVDIEESTLGGYKLSLNEMERTIRVERVR